MLYDRPDIDSRGTAPFVDSRCVSEDYCKEAGYGET
jgi:hypothetical protein